jgi:dipeptidyl aminopeptidase/acylaminoacyl peptidase
MSTRPYGSWPTPVTSELVVRAARTIGALAPDGDDLWWSEGRPEEGGRIAVLRRRADGSVDEVLGAPWSARTAVHEYGGGAWWVVDGVLWFADWASQRLHRLGAADETPVPLTPEPAVARGLRYADGSVSPDGSTILCVREDHTTSAPEAVNTIVRLAADAPSEPAVVVSGPDFVACPRWSPDGSAWCWIEWDHPDMPWDATRLVVSDGVTRTVVAGGAARESVCQAAWAPDGSLWFSGDRTGFWSLYRWTPRDGAVEAMVEIGRDVGFPHWVFGESCFAFLADGAVAFRYVEHGIDHLAVRAVDGTVTPLELPFTSIATVAGHGSTLLLVAATPTTEMHGAAVELVDGGAIIDTVVPGRDLGLDDSWWSVPEPVEFPTAAGAVAHGLLYHAHNPEWAGPDGARPPLIVVIHGGPTSAAHVSLKVAYQFWTTRGFAVVDVNHRGSTGYGRAFRDLLQGQWGIVDVEDCAAVARFLVGRGDVDGARVCIRGGSAGGFTTLAALAFQDAFSAGASYYGVADLGALARDTHKFESRYLDGLVGPWPAAREVYEARSPLFHVDGIDRPLAVFQGLDDEVVPPAQSEVIVEAVRAKGLPVVYLTFAGEGHGFRQAANIRAALDAELAFYTEVLGLA